MIFFISFIISYMCREALFVGQTAQQTVEAYLVGQDLLQIVNVDALLLH